VERQSGLADCYVSEKGVQSRQAIVSRSGTVAACELKVFQKLPDKGRIDIFRPQLGWRAAKMLGGVLEQQTKGVPVRRYSVRTRPQLCPQTIGEEKLNQGLKAGGAHR
jgi:hypothetical protein